MQIYKGLPYFAESPYSDPKARSVNSAKSVDLKFKLNPLKYSKSNSIFVKPVQKEDLDHKVKNSVIITRFTSQPKPFTTTHEMQRSIYRSAHDPQSARSVDQVRSADQTGNQNLLKSQHINQNQAQTYQDIPDTQRLATSARPQTSIILSNLSTVADEKGKLKKMASDQATTLRSIRSRQNYLRFSHRVPKDVEATNFLKKEIVVDKSNGATERQLLLDEETGGKHGFRDKQARRVYRAQKADLLRNREAGHPRENEDAGAGGRDQQAPRGCAPQAGTRV